MNYELSIAIDAPREHVWAVLTDVERWPEWTASMTKLTYVDGNKLAIGSKVRVKQPRLPAVVMEVVEFEPQQSFTWKATSAGVVTSAFHRITSGPGSSVTVTLGLQQSGSLAWLVGLLIWRVTRRYVQMEAEGLKRRAEAAARTTAE